MREAGTAPMILTECTACADERAAGAAFCESCGRSLSTEAAARSSPDWMDCPHCEAERTVGTDGYCEECGMLAGRPRDHLEADGGPVAAAVSDRGRRHHRNEDAMWLAVGVAAADVVVCDGVSASYDPDAASDIAARTAGEFLAAAQHPGGAAPGLDADADADADVTTDLSAVPAELAAAEQKTTNLAAAEQKTAELAAGEQKTTELAAAEEATTELAAAEQTTIELAATGSGATPGEAGPPPAAEETGGHATASASPDAARPAPDASATTTPEAAEPAPDAPERAAEEQPAQADPAAAGDPGDAKPHTPIGRAIAVPGKPGPAVAIAGVVAAAIAGAAEAVASLAHTGDPRRSVSNPACTIVAAAVRGPHVGFGWVGDSRAYWLTEDGPAEQLTEDDSWARHVIALGVDPQVAMNDPKAHAITAWLGADAGPVRPRVGAFTATKPGFLVLCSDGLWNYLPDPAGFADVVRACLSAATGPSPLLAAARALVAYANEAGGADNITVALIPVQPAEVVTPAA
ncbi:protein phosphatase 2C domain-containing protein [Actinoplanes aureus]|uniref:protein phosphatase 2C domain-containing protein n=1 Tax=Actinoplanes aureus TaxID=2792083 RepID=UPI001E539399|nr:protein phosphatase 2C domain-containing protein [Actinoplanes aureus]